MIQIQNKSHSYNKKNILKQFSCSCDYVATLSPKIPTLISRTSFAARSPRDHTEEYQEVYISFKSLKPIFQEVLLYLIRNGLNCSHTIWCSLKAIAADLGLSYVQVRYRLKRLSELGYTRRIWRKVGCKTFTRVMMACVCVDLPKIVTQRNKLSSMNYLNPKKNNSKQDGTERLHESSDISHCFKNETPKDPLPIAQNRSVKYATCEEVLKLAETYGFNVSGVDRQTKRNIFGSTRQLKMDLKRWENVFAYAKNNPFLNGTTSDFKATLKFIVSISTVDKIERNEYKQYQPKNNQSQNLNKKSLNSKNDKNEISPNENSSQKTSNSVVNKVWSIMRASMIWSGKKRYEYIEAQLLRIGLLDRVKATGLRWENFFDKTDKKLIDNLLRTI